MVRVVLAILLGLMIPLTAARSSSYQQLLDIYEQFRTAIEPEVRTGVPDYSSTAMAAQRRRVRALQDQLEAIDDGAWPVPQRVDLLLALAEMRSVEFHHRVLRPWERDPVFYSALDIGWGPKIGSAIPLPQFPIREPERLAAFARGLRSVPSMLAAARANLVDLRGDLVRLGIDHKAIEERLFQRMERDLRQHHPDLAPAASAARAATAEFIAWLRSREAAVPPWAGIGREEFDWYVRYVLLMPYSWGEMRSLGEREWQRSIAFLKLEEHAGRAVPMIEPATSLAEFERRREEADADLLNFLRRERILTVPDWLVPARNEGPYIMPVNRDPAAPGPFDAPVRRNFFREAEDRDPRSLRAHNIPGHLLDMMSKARDARPIRGRERVNFIDSSRVEGWAFYLEEMLLQAGFLADHQKAREIHYILQAKRAARIAPELLMHSNDWALQEALQALTSRTPYWMAPDDDTAIYDLALYLRQPGLGINYYFGKLQIEQLLAELGHEQGRDFDLQQFHDRFLASGLIPISLIRWEMTGRDDQVRLMR
jgi:uncharacterized protein (DUF885 family)